MVGLPYIPMSGDFVDSIVCLYSATVTKQGDSYVIDVPEREIAMGDVDPGSTVRVAILNDGTERRPSTASTASTSSSGRSQRRTTHPEPPVEAGDVRDVTIESTGDQGDGIAKIDRGFVVIVPGATPGDEVTVEIDSVQPNYAVAEIVEEQGDALW